jgi:hypothetical protein
MSHPWNGPIVPDWQLERFRLGELPPDQMQSVARAAEEDEAVRMRIEALERDSAAILAELPPWVMGVRIRARLEPFHAPASPRFPRWCEGLVATLAFVGVCGGLLGPRPAAEVSPPRTPVLEQTRLKGLRPRLFVFRQTEAGAETLETGSRAGRDDVLQLAYQSAGRRYGTIVSIDGRGVTTRHLPTRGVQASKLVSGPPVALQTAYRLDDAPRFEVFYLVAADEPFELTVVEAAARKVSRKGRPAERLPLGDGFSQHSLMIRKDGLRRSGASL